METAAAAAAVAKLLQSFCLNLCFKISFLGFYSSVLQKKIPSYDNLYFTQQKWA